MQEYLNLLDKDASKFLFACYDYRKIKKEKQIYGTLDFVKPKLEQYNREGYCVYITVNETDGPKRRKENIIRARAIWVEDDNVQENGFRTDFPIEPSLIVESSKGKYHYYWFTSTKKIDEWNQVMKTMVISHGCDNKAKDISRVLRLPGFKHNKDPKNPFLTRIVANSGKRYLWQQIRTHFPPFQETEQTKEKEKEFKYSEDNAVNELLTSKNYHGSLTSIAMSLSNRRVSRQLQYMTLYGLMQKIPKEKRRPEWEARISEEHLYECIDSAIKKVEEEEKVDFSKTAEYDTEEPTSKTEFPPGLIGDLCQNIFDMAPYQNKEIAVAGAMGLVAGICGRKYNILGMGLNIYIAILADSGIGKANLKDSINLALRGGGPLNLGQIFAGQTKFTGPRAVFNMLHQGLSRICVMEEAGLSAESAAGDQAGLTRVFLDLFTSSGYGKWAGDEGYSDAKNSLPALHSPALSVVNVSTPKSFLKSLKTKSADVSGEVARLWMIRSLGEKPYFNRNRKEYFDNPVLKRLGELIKICLPVQLPDSDLEVIDIDINPEYYDDADKWVDKENENAKKGNTLRRTLCSRAWAKIVKMAAICSVFNGKSEIGEEEYNWATRTVEYELNSIDTAFNYGISDDLRQVANFTVARIIMKILKREYKDEKYNAPKNLAEIGGFTYQNLVKACANNTVVKDWDDDPSRPNPKTGVDKILFHLVKSGVVEKIDEIKLKTMGSKTKLAFRITEDFKLIFEGD